MVDGEEANTFAEFEAQANGDKPATGGDPEPPVEKADPEPEGEPIEGEPEGEEGAEEQEAEGDEPEAEQPKRNKKPAHERIAELSTKVREAERREAEALRRIEELTRKEPEAVPPKEEKAADEGRPNPDDYELGDVDSRYVADLAEWIADRKINAILAERETKAEAAKLTDSYKERASEAAARYPDYDEVVTKGAEQGEWPCSEAMRNVILASPAGPDIAYHLASDTAEAVRISQLHPAEQLYEMGLIAGKFIGKETPSKKTTSAPPPPVTLPRGSGGKFTASPDTEDFSAFEKLANKA